MFDATIRWEDRVALRQLTEHLPRGRCGHAVACVDATARRWLRSREPPLFPRRFDLDVLDAPRALRRYLVEPGADVIHAWGVRAAAVAEHATHTMHRPVALTLWDSQVDARGMRHLRREGDPHARPIICGGDAARRRLIGCGVDATRCVVIRPAADVATIERARRSGIRERLGLTDEHTLITAPEPVVPGAGHFAAFWLTAIRSFLDPGIRLVVSGWSREQARIQRLARQLGMDHLLICPPSGVACEELIAVADAVVVAPSVETSPGGLAWALVAGVPVVGTSVDSVRELITHGVNGWLIAPGPAKRLATRLASAVGQLDALRDAADAARADAEHQFAPPQAAQRHARLYENVVAGRPPWDGAEAAEAPARSA